MTKNELYDVLICKGRAQGFSVIPEFSFVLNRHRNARRQIYVDLVWAQRKSGVPMRQDRDNLNYWTIYATFEIESCTVAKGNIDRGCCRHFERLPRIRNQPPQLPIKHYVVLYTQAYDLRTRKFDREMTGKANDDVMTRIKWSTKNVKVLDGRSLEELEALRQKHEVEKG